MSDFVHLHVHSHYSIMDSIVSIPSLIEKTVSEGMGSVALTDHGNMFGAIDFYTAAMDAGINPIIGYEAFLAAQGIEHKNDREYHITLLAENMSGYRNLMKLASIAYTEGFYLKPRIDFKLLRRHHQGLICLSGCSKSIISEEIHNSNHKGARQWVLKLQSIFGEGNFYLELQRNHLIRRKKILDGHMKLSEELGIPVAATNNVHYISRDDAEAHDVFLNIGREQSVPGTSGYSSKTDGLFFRTAQEMEELFSDIPQAVENTGKIASRCNLKLDFNQWHMPKFENKEGISSNSYLEKLCFDGLKKRYKDIPEDAAARLEHELQIIKNMGFANYFLAVHDFVQYAQKNNIPMGPGRGPAAGSLVNYALGITQIDPLKYGGVFERFLNEGKNEPPDIDIDFCRDRRKEVIEYLRKKHGRENVTGITTFGTFGARGTVHKVAGVLGVDSSKEDRIAGFIPDRPRITLEEVLNAEPELGELSRQDPEVKKVLDIGFRIEGLICSVGTHAAGVVIPDKSIMEYTPLFKIGNTLSTQYEKNALEKLGLIKMDFLGLRTLTVIEEAVNLIKKNRKTDVNINEIPLDEKKVYMMLSKGDTFGVFSFQSAGMQNLLQAIQPDCFNDIAACIALYSSGPLEIGMADTYIECKHCRETPRYLHEKLKPLIKSTYGLFLYQEQIIKAIHEIAGFSLSEAEIFRRAFCKKPQEIISKRKDVFIRGAAGNGISKEEAKRIYDGLKNYSKYAFNKAHSVAYGLIAYQTAYLKALYPREFHRVLEMNCG